MVNEKLCREDAIAKGQKVFWRDKPCPRGHSGWFRIGGGCVECQRQISNRYKSENKEILSEKRKKYLQSAEAKRIVKNYMDNGGRQRAAERMRKWRKNNPEKVKERNAKHSDYMKRTKEERREKRRAYYAENKERIREQQRKYRDENREKIRESRRKYYRNYMRERRKNDPNFKVLTRMRDFNRRCIEAIKGVKNWRTKEELGYTPEEMRKHIESLWLENMSWENYGEWHIDHIRSIKSFIDDGVTDVKIINALTNLQPLWAFDNLSKGA